MRSPASLLLATLLAALIWIGLPALYAEDDAPTQVETVAAAESVVAAARTAEEGDAATIEALLAARKSLEPWIDEVRTLYWDEPGKRHAPALATVWNELLTVLSSHGYKVTSEYVLKKQGIIWNRYFIGLPVGGRWKVAANSDKDTWDQLHMFIRQYRPGGELLREIKVWNYRWDTTYSGIGGENYKKLASVMHELDRDCVAKTGRKASRSVKARKLNQEFKRVYYYFVEGLDVDAEEHLRRQSYYLKGNWDYTHCLEVITHIDPLETDDRVTIWQTEDDRREFETVLSSFITNPDYELPK